MRLNRGLWLVLALAPLGIFAGGVARTQGLAPVVGAVAKKHVVLPADIRQRPNGQYMKRICPTCRGFFHLPADWQPGMATPSRPVPEPAAPAAHAMTPTDIQTAYKLTSTTSTSGKIVAILDTPNSHAMTDVNAYRTKYGITTLAACTGPGGMPTGSGTACFAQINEDGTPSTGTDPSPDDDGETSLDMDMISAACPDCTILLVEISPNFCEPDFLTGVKTATSLGASAVSISIGGPEATDPNYLAIDAGTEDAGELQCPTEANWEFDAPGPYSSPGTLVFVASGDFAYDNGSFPYEPGGASPSYPSSSPYVIAVGGTTLYLNGTTYGEGVWDDGAFGVNVNNPDQDVTTSGCSTEFAMPPWQASVLSGTTCKHRATADISAAAAFYDGTKDEGIEIVLDGAASGGYEGTSAASPMVAAIFTRLGLTTEASNDLSWIYTNIAAFNDVGSTAYPIPTTPVAGKSTDAPAGSTCGKLCTAGTGWDGPTGVGTPNGTELAALPVSTSGPEPYPDAGVTSVTGTDEDAGTTDHDAGNEVDSGTEHDAGTEADAGHDAGTEHDAGAHDAGTEVDAGHDAGTSHDAGEELDATTTADASSDGNEDSGSAATDDAGGTGSSSGGNGGSSSGSATDDAGNPVSGSSSGGITFTDDSGVTTTVGDDGGTGDAEGSNGSSGNSSGCGCTTVGTRSDGTPLQLGLFAFGAALVMVRRRKK